VRSTAQLRAIWGPPCRISTVTIKLYGEGRVTVDRRIAGAVYALNRVLARHRYRTRYADTGAYVCRRITGGSGYSLHAYGIALDINWLSNPYGRRLVTNMPRGMVNEILAIRTNSGDQVWGWGGNYSVHKDAMHFEVVASPAEIASGIRGGGGVGTVVSIPQPPKELFTMGQYEALNDKLDIVIGGLMKMQAQQNEDHERIEDTTRRVREMREEWDRWMEDTVRRVREMHDAAGLGD
jgi:hypothetical protein